MKIGARFAQVGRHPTRRTMKGPKWGEWPGWIRSRPISRVLSGAAIHLGCTSPYTSCDLPEDCAGRTSSSYLVLLRTGFTVPLTVAGGAVRSYRTLSPLPTVSMTSRGRSTLCCTFRRLAPPRGYLAFCPMEPRLSSTPQVMPRRHGRLSARSLIGHRLIGYRCLSSPGPRHRRFSSACRSGGPRSWRPSWCRVPARARSTPPPARPRCLAYRVPVPRR